MQKAEPQGSDVGCCPHSAPPSPTLHVRRAVPGAPEQLSSHLDLRTERPLGLCVGVGVTVALLHPLCTAPREAETSGESCSVARWWLCAHQCDSEERLAEPQAQGERQATGHLGRTGGRWAEGRGREDSPPDLPSSRIPQGPRCPLLPDTNHHPCSQALEVTSMLV